MSAAAWVAGIQRRIDAREGQRAEAQAQLQQTGRLPFRNPAPVRRSASVGGPGKAV